MDATVVYRTLFAIIYNITPLTAYAVESYGWIPISALDVYNPYFKSLKNQEHFISRDNSWNPTNYYEKENVKVVKNNRLQIVQPATFEIIEKEHVIINKDKEKTNGSSENEKREEQDLLNNETKNNETKQIHDRDNIDINIDKQTRKAKKIALYNSNDNTNDVTLKTNDFKQLPNKDINFDASRNTYEVTESSDTKNIFKADDSISDEQGYNYKQPKLNQLNSNSLTLTNRFQNILSKYNININDKLPNYALSLGNKFQNPGSDFILVPMFRTKFPHGYNSLNHLPVDPLLAVFLSNYGYYLQGLYGKQNDYKNLYGYLASNNIHNNNPLGSYKIFSDTDSSN